MAYELSWHVPDKVLILSLSGDYSLSDAKQVNEQIVDALVHSPSPLVVLINAVEMKRPYNFQELRGTQAYMNHANLKRIAVVASDRIIMLAMIAIFNLGRAPLSMFNDVHKATSFLEKDGAKTY